MRDCNNSKFTESDEEIDAISYEEIGEHSSKEAPFRQPVHETKSTLQLLKINSESMRCDISELNDVKPVEHEKSLEDNYQKLRKYDPVVHPSSKYVPESRSPPHYEKRTVNES